MKMTTEDRGQWRLEQWGVALLLSVALCLACSSESKPPAGTEGNGCRAGGGCDDGLICEADLCQPKAPVEDPLEGCTPACDGALCGPDGCGGSCGDCGGLENCVAGECVCAPQCNGLQCGDDGCGGSCGTCTGDLECMAGVCICHPECDGMECGDNGCGGTCGECEWPAECFDGTCLCEPDCDWSECGDDGCGGSCGTCDEGFECIDWECFKPCEPDCLKLDCGDDGCGGSCGTCGEDAPYCVAGECAKECDADCTGLLCGDDGCGGSCGLCDGGKLCDAGVCVDGGPCGECPQGTECGFFEDPADWCGGEGCAPDLKYEGECGGDDGKTLIWCEEDTTIAIDCDFFDSESGCDWSDEVGYYDCL
jgi:hypothetical protein